MASSLGAGVVVSLMAGDMSTRTLGVSMIERIRPAFTPTGGGCGRATSMCRVQTVDI
jgi:hypothetical protein